MLMSFMWALEEAFAPVGYYTTAIARHPATSSS